MRAELRGRDLGGLLGLVFQLATGRFGPMFLVMLLGNLPQILVQLLLLPDVNQLQVDNSPAAMSRFLEEFGMGFGVWSVVYLVTYPLLEAACILIAAQAFIGDERSAWECVKEAARRSGTVILLFLGLGLILTLGICPGMFVGFLVFKAWFYVALPVVLLEGAGWIEAMQRSRSLVSGRTLEVLAVFVVTNWGLGFVVAPFVLIPNLLLQDHYYANVLVQSFLSLVYMLIPMVAPVAVYYHLRVVREHYDIQRLAELVPKIPEA